ncbi:NAD-dependent epimerase/dehydratase family protein [Archaeoglobus sp.]
MERILVTGGAGYIGNIVVEKLIEKDYKVRVLDLMLFGDDALKPFRDNENLEVIEGDIRHIRDLVYATKGVDAVIHLAGIVGDPACSISEEATLSVNVEATKAIMEICKRYGVERIIFASSCSVYGASKMLVLNEGSFLNPLSLYAKTKIDSEQIILNHASYFDVNRMVPVILRFATAFGWSRRMRFDIVVNLLTAKAMIDKEITIFGGDQYRPFAHVQDLADACIAAMEADRELVDRQIFNVGDNNLNYRISEVGEIVAKIIPEAEVKYIKHKEDDRNYRVSFDKINYVLGWKAKWSLEDGVKEMKREIEKLGGVNYRDSKYRNSDYPYM